MKMVFVRGNKFEMIKNMMKSTTKGWMGVVVLLMIIIRAVLKRPFTIGDLHCGNIEKQ